VRTKKIEICWLFKNVAELSDYKELNNLKLIYFGECLIGWFSLQVLVQGLK